MEEKSPKCSREKEEDVPTSIAMEKDNDKDPAGPVSGTITAAAHERLRSEEMACFQHIFEVRKLSEKNNLMTTCDFYFPDVEHTFACECSQPFLRLSRNKILPACRRLVAYRTARSKREIT